MRYKEFNTEEFKKDGTYLIRAMTYEQNHSPPHELRAFLAIPEVRKELEKLRFVIKNTPLKLLNKIPRSEIVNDLLLRHNFQISPRGKELIYNYLKGSDQYLEEESPNTLEGSFTEDLVTSKQWLCEKLKNLVKDKSCKTIYILGSWYGNLALFLEKHDINYDKIVLVDKDSNVLKSSEQLLRPLFDMGKLVFLNTDACDMIYDKPGIVINTSVNDMDSSWYDKVPKNMPVLLQARDSVSDSVTKIADFEQFNDMFPMNKVYYLGKKELADPETSYTRYMKIGQK